MLSPTREVPHLVVGVPSCLGHRLIRRDGCARGLRILRRPRKRDIDAQRAARRFLAEVEDATVAAATGRTFPDLWRAVCAALGKQLEFRGYAMLEVQVDELVQRGMLRRDGDRIVRA